MGAPPNSNLAESSASVVERDGSGAGSAKPSRRPAAATGVYGCMQSVEM